MSDNYRLIQYYLSDIDMGGNHKKSERFREWVKEKIQRKFPGHEVVVSAEQKFFTPFYTDDEENREKIYDFCSRIWDGLPWDWFDVGP